jgi:CheY-like chemotaxis protein
VVEDDVLVRIPIAQYLRDCGYKVIEAVDADEAMVVLLYRETVLDVVLSDIEMPGSVDGFGLAKWIREHRPGLDVILAGTVPREAERAKELCGSLMRLRPFIITFAACLRRARRPKRSKTDNRAIRAALSMLVAALKKEA